MNENAPAPSKFIFLHEVASQPLGTKVRLLGCIVQYDTAKGQVLLEHAYPDHAHPTPRICVDVSLVLESTKSSTFNRGTWINVIGYIQGSRLQIRKKKDSLQQKGTEIPSLQAILAWDAGPVRIADYEHTVEEQRRVMRQLKSNDK